ncbi:MAG: bifunctional riboflavin kinase/FAD synthetase [Crocinitomicaceae bacterium]|jgi:riboflavin kinase/FMN adenylyltransferase|nr:bifunctional riboflavin kinase/FAD synthetase [Crocinitomicaceae bacterium]
MSIFAVLMKVHYSFDAINAIKNPVLTIGTFDGVHVGHQKILKRLNEEARRNDGESVLFTFHPHPRLVLDPGNTELKILQTQEEKIRKLERMGLDHLIIYPFTKDFSNTKAEDFIREFLVEKLHVHTIVVGYDHQFGKNREGSLEHLEKLSKIYPFRVIEIPAHEIDEVNVSSTKIRKALINGDIEIANTYLNEPYEISGHVAHGRQLGRTIGFPTANIAIAESHKLIPKIGVYAVKVMLEDRQTRYGMMNIGVNPTVTDENSIKIEVCIFDFSETIYDRQISVYLLKRTRDEKRFDSLDELTQAIHNDELEIRAFLAASAH